MEPPQFCPRPRRVRLSLSRSPTASAASSPVPRHLGARDARRHRSPHRLPPLRLMLWTVFRSLPFEQRLENVAKAGYTNVELVGEYAKWSPRRLRPRQRRAASASGSPLTPPPACPTVSAILPAATPSSPNFRQALTPMETIACPAMIVLSGNVVPGLSREAQHQSCIEGLKSAAALVEGRKINGQPVSHPPRVHRPRRRTPDTSSPPPPEAIQIVRAVSHPRVQFLYDLFHEQIAEGNLLEKLEKSIDVISLIHIASSRRPPPTGCGDQPRHLPQLARSRYRRPAAGIPAAVTAT